MKLNNLLVTILTLAYIITSSTKCHSQKVEKPKMIEVEGHFVKSTNNGKTYQLYVTLPFEYEQETTKKYPVLYQLDGIYSFPIIHSTKGVLESQGEIEPIITIAIADSIISPTVFMSSRYFDFMPVQDKVQDSLIAYQSRMPKELVISGGSDEFIATLENDIIPFIDKNYRTNGNNGIAGHSAGGLFAAYCLFNKPDLFERYAINSAALQWGNDFMLHFENQFYNKSKELPKRVLVSVAENDIPDILRTYKLFKELIQKRKYTGLDVRFVEFEDESHNSVIPGSISKTLTVLYGRNTK